jgi:hypothetical protein
MYGICLQKGDPMTTEEATQKLKPITFQMLKRDSKLLPGIDKLDERQLETLAEYISGKILTYNLVGVVWGHDIATFERERPTLTLRGGQ